jgi:hypothetical protein
MRWRSESEHVRYQKSRLSGAPFLKGRVHHEEGSAELETATIKQQEQGLEGGTHQVITLESLRVVLQHRDTSLYYQ